MHANTYDKLAFVYDQDAHEYNVDCFFKAIRPYIQQLEQGSAVLDVGCGTGLLTRRIAETGLPVHGIDCSAGMIDIARRRCDHLSDRVAFQVADVLSIEPRPNYSMVVASGEIANHLPNARALEKLIRFACRSLAPCGMFAFDTVTRFSYERLWHDRTYFLQNKTGDLIMECSFDSASGWASARMVAYAIHNGLFARTESHLKERFYGDPTVRNLMCKSGFVSIRRLNIVRGSSSLSSPTERALWIGTLATSRAKARWRQAK